MNSCVRRRCANCRQSFAPDYRNVRHQRYCSQPGCRQASKRASQRRWLQRPENRNYFRDPQNVCRVREWRQAHPGYWRCGRPHYSTRAGVDLCDNSRRNPAETPADPGTLQDLCRSRSPFLIGLISELERCALQEDIARCATQMLREAQCILLHCKTSISANLHTGRPRICDDTS